MTEAVSFFIFPAFPRVQMLIYQLRVPKGVEIHQ